MRKIIFAHFGDISAISDEVSHLKATLTGNVSSVIPGSEDGAESPKAWLRRQAPKAEFIVIIICPPEAPLAPMTAAPDGDGVQRIEVETEPFCAANEFTIPINEDCLPSIVSSGTQVLVAVSTEKGHCDLPAKLKHSILFNLSATDSLHALLCKLVHDPVGRKAPDSRSQIAVLGVVSGLIGTLAGTNSKIQSLLAAQVQNDVVLTFVYYSIVAVVIFLLVIGIIAVMQIAISHLNEMIPWLGTIALPPSKRGVLRKVLFTCAGLGIASITISCFGKPKHADDIVSSEIPKWSKRLATSQVANGGIREHHEQGVAQVWMTSQAMVGLLSSPASPDFGEKDVSKALKFIGDARITPFDLKKDSIPRLQQQLTPFLKETPKLARIPSHYPSFALLYGMIARLDGDIFLNSRAVKILGANKSDYFIVSQQPDEGWGYFEQWGWGVTEIAAWVGIAEIACLRANPAVIEKEKRESVKEDVRKIVELLGRRQIEHVGGFSPISEIDDPTFARTYSTIMAAWTISEALSPDLAIYNEEESAALQLRLQESIEWLISSAQGEAGWKINPNNPTDEKPALGLAAQTVFIIERAPVAISQKNSNKLLSIKRHLLKARFASDDRDVSNNDRIHDADRYLYPTDKAIEGSTLLWYPWCVAAMRSMSTDKSLTSNEQKEATRLLKRLSAQASGFSKFALSEYNYVAAEGLIGFGWPCENRNKMP